MRKFTKDIFSALGITAGFGVLLLALAAQTPQDIDVDDEMGHIIEILSQYEVVTFGDPEYPDVVVDLLNGRIDVFHDADEETQEFWDYAQLYLEYQRNR